MAPSLKLTHASRYAQVGALLLRHRHAAADRDGLLFEPDDAERGNVEEDGLKLVAELEAMGPTFVKLGQLLSTRADLLPAEYLEALSKLQDRVEPMPAAMAKAIVAEELGVRVSKAFSSFEDRPLGSASIGQVHRGALRDGRPVAVKVQRPDVRDQVTRDMEVIGELATWLDLHSDTASQYGFAEMVERFRHSLMGELDYRLEATNLKLLGSDLAGYERLIIPQPIDDYCTSRVLTMTYVDGRNISSTGPLAQLEVGGRELAEELFNAYLDQVLVHGVFHADPHPGNVLLATDGRLALVDLGQVARIDPETQEHLLRLVLAVSNTQSREAVESLEALGERLDGFDRTALAKRVSDLVLQIRGLPLEDLKIGRMLGDMAAAAAENGLRPAAELTLVGKAMLNLDEVARKLDPGFRPDEAVRAHAASIMHRRMLRAASPTNLLASTLDAKEFVERLPDRLNKVLDSLAEGRFTLNIAGVDEAQLMRGVQKLANRCALGIVIAALVLAAAIFATAKVGPDVWGYPSLTIVFLLLAAAAGAWLVIGIVRSDLPQRKKPRG